jgi:hypothetical protein
MPQFDAAAYMQMFQYMQSLAQQPGLMGMPTMPFPGAAPYAPQTTVEPSVNVSVEGMKFQYQLTEDDLQKVFTRYGTVKHITVDEAGASAVITFHTFQDAQAAMHDLNGKVLNGLDGILRITWSQPEAALASPYAGMAPPPALPGWGAFPPAVPPPAGMWPPPPGPPRGAARISRHGGRRHGPRLLAIPRRTSSGREGGQGGAEVHLPLRARNRER